VNNNTLLIYFFHSFFVGLGPVLNLSLSIHFSMKQRLIFLLKEKKQKLFEIINSLFNHQTKILLIFLQKNTLFICNVEFWLAK
jgi:hypothetical protein